MQEEEEMSYTDLSTRFYMYSKTKQKIGVYWKYDQEMRKRNVATRCFKKKINFTECLRDSWLH